MTAILIATGTVAAAGLTVFAWSVLREVDRDLHEVILSTELEDR